jgi:O-antigen/teichoic acid export membrane protein
MAQGERMSDTREVRAKKNIVISFGCQIITLVCGLVVPRLMLGAFGSEVYGAVSSISQFLAYITLLEGGIGGVARAVLYKPLAQKDMGTISAIVAEIRRFFRVIAMIFAVYVLVLGCTFKSISNVESLDWISAFMLVLVISISTFGQYFIGISYSVLLQAAQKSYITNLVNIIGTILNTAAIVALVMTGCNIIIVRLVSSLIFFMKPVALWLYVRKHYKLEKTGRTEKTYLTQKWSGLGQHIAYFLHSNTDVVVLTVLADLKSVAVYSVYNMVTANIQNLCISFISGMEALFGDMLAKEEYDQLHRTFGLYETIISVITLVLFSTTAVLIVPFVKIYTAGVTDTNYYEPVFAILLVIAMLLYCLRMPYHSLVIAAGHFKQTGLAAYGEAVINVVVSCLLVHQYGLIGVAIGTIVATAFRFLYYVYYLSKRIFSRKIGLFVKRMITNAGIFIVVYALGSLVTDWITIDHYMTWAFCGVLVVAISAVVTAVGYLLAYRNDCVMLFHKVFHFGNAA